MNHGNHLCISPGSDAKKVRSTIGPRSQEDFRPEKSRFTISKISRCTKPEILHDEELCNTSCIRPSFVKKKISWSLSHYLFNLIRQISVTGARNVVLVNSTNEPNFFSENFDSLIIPEFFNFTNPRKKTGEKTWKKSWITTVMYRFECLRSVWGRSATEDRRIGHFLEKVESHITIPDQKNSSYPRENDHFLVQKKMYPGTFRPQRIFFVQFTNFLKIIKLFF